MNRRGFVMGGLGLATAAGLAACGSGSGTGTGGGASAGSAALTMGWWGNDVRNKNTQASIEAYQKANEGVTISGQPGEWASYWDKLATQTAGGGAPDVIQMDMAYIGEYGHRGALLDLSKVDTSKFLAGTVDSGKIDGKLVGVNAGVNCLTIMVHPDVWAKAGMTPPDDKTWTWDSAIDISAEIAKKTGSVFGFAALTSDSMFWAWLRQTGKQLFDDKGIAFDQADADHWFDYSQRAFKAGAVGTPQAMTEDGAKPIAQQALATGGAALAVANSNQVEALNQASGKSLGILRYPTITGKVADRKAWYKASMLWSASAKTKNPEAVIKLIDWWVNSDANAAIEKAERGMPANGDVQKAVSPQLSAAQQGVQKFLADIEPEVGATPIAPPTGGGKLGEIMNRHIQDMLFGKQSQKDAAKGFMDELKSTVKA